MMTLCSRILSYITHPILTVTYLLAFVLFQKDSYLYYTISSNGRWFFLLVTVLLTVVAPLISVGYLLYTKQISSIHLDNRQERIIPLTISAAYTFGLYYLFLKFSMPPIIMTVIGIGVIGVILTLLITLFWKISAHMIGVAGFNGAVLGISQTFQSVDLAVIVLLFILSGMVGTARIKLGAHSLNQVLTGWVLGLGVSYTAVIFLMNS